jgi:putative transposase
LVTVGVELGVNTLLAATDGETAVGVRGREAKAIQQYRNKQLASLRSRQERCKPGSRLHKRLQRRKKQHLARCARKQRDLCHKATRAVARAFPDTRGIVGKPYNPAATHLGRRQAQQVSQARTARIIQQLGYTLSGVVQVSEAYRSQTCPVCGCRQRCLRLYRCKTCGLEAPREVVGATNLRALRLYGGFTPAQPMAKAVHFVRPLLRYPGC